MNTDYLNSLPEIENKFGISLEPGEKIIFTVKSVVFGTESGELLGWDDSRVTMTNRRIIADNGRGIWTTDIAEDVVDMCKKEKGKFLMKEVYMLVTLNKECIYGTGFQKLNGYRFYFKKKDMAVFEEIIRHMA